MMPGNQIPGALNPFAALTREIADKVLADHRMKRQAEQRLTKLMASYRELVGDPRYQPLVQELRGLMGEQLRTLVQRATKCAHCGPLANRVTVLDELLVAPLEMVWFERQGQPEEAAPDADDGA